MDKEPQIIISGRTSNEIRFRLSEKFNSNEQIKSICEKYIKKAKKKEFLNIKSPNTVLEFEWGCPFIFGTPSYWITQYYLHFLRDTSQSFTLGETLLEEVIACILGGYGIPAEMGLRAFHELKRNGLTVLNRHCQEEDFFEVLNRPLLVEGKYLRYRFAKQKSQRVSSAVKFFSNKAYIPEFPKQLRNWLLQIPGIGLKTASWIVRNYTKTDDVAIIDVHIHRAGMKAGFFHPDWTPSKNYLGMEEAFLGFAKLGGAAVSGLDSIIWSQMRIRHSLF